MCRIEDAAGADGQEGGGQEGRSGVTSTWRVACPAKSYDLVVSRNSHSGRGRRITGKGSRA